MEILVIGGGGREHAIVHTLKKSKKADKIYCLPGNAGIAEIAECHDINVMDFDGILKFLNEHSRIGLTVVAPDNPLAGGLVDRLTSAGHRAFGPSAAAALIEASKSYSKDLMRINNIPTAKFRIFTEVAPAIEYLKKGSFPVVVKADGLAFGKGVIIAKTFEEGAAAVRSMLEEGCFGESGKEIVIEEFLKGFEVSVLAFTDGKAIVPMESSQDHKRALDGDKGLNTGGMGAICPSKKYTNKMKLDAFKSIFVPTIKALEKDGRLFKGVIYFGLMIDTECGDKDKYIKVLEYNARFGDPETQAVLLRLETDLVDIMEAVIDGKLADIDVKFDNEAAACVVLASSGYPEKYEVGKKIVIGDIPRETVLFHAGTKVQKDTLVTSGGRVLGVSAKGKNVNEALKTCYKAIKNISFDGMHYRKDIGK